MSIRLRVPAIDDPDFLADVAYGEVAELRLTGTADTAATAPLSELLTSLHGELQERRVPEIVVDMRGLRFMNAACSKGSTGCGSSARQAADRFRPNPDLLAEAQPAPFLFRYGSRHHRELTALPDGSSTNFAPSRSGARAPRGGVVAGADDLNDKRDADPSRGPRSGQSRVVGYRRQPGLPQARRPAGRARTRLRRRRISISPSTWRCASWRC